MFNDIKTPTTEFCSTNLADRETANLRGCWRCRYFDPKALDRGAQQIDWCRLVGRPDIIKPEDYPEGKFEYKCGDLCQTKKEWFNQFPFIDCAVVGFSDHDVYKYALYQECHCTAIHQVCAVLPSGGVAFYLECPACENRGTVRVTNSPEKIAVSQAYSDQVSEWRTRHGKIESVTRIRPED
jgi:hypothetical protein